MVVSTYERDNRLAVLRGSDHVSVATYYASLHSGDPGLTGASELAAAEGYARVAITAAVGSWSAPATNGAVRQITNSNVLTFGPATGDGWIQATYGGLWDAEVGGNFIRPTAAFPTPKTAGVGDPISFPVGSFIVQES